MFGELEASSVLPQNSTPVASFPLVLRINNEPKK